MTNVSPLLLVVYAQDIQRVAAFYARTLSGRVAETGDGYVLVVDDRCEVAVVQMPRSLIAANPLSDPPHVREHTPLKPSFFVDDLPRVRAAAADTGGAVRAAAAEWEWRAQVHVDGYDPEGNPVQFRTRAT